LNMLTVTDALCVGNSPVDTGLEKFARAVPRVIPPNLDAAIAADVCNDLKQLQAASKRDHEQAEAYLVEVNSLHERIIERQHIINAHCTFLLDHGRAPE